MQYRRREIGSGLDGRPVWAVEARRWWGWITVFRGDRDAALRAEWTLSVLSREA